MHSNEELVSCITDLARRAGARLSAEQHLVNERDFRLGLRTELRRTINDAPLASVAFLEQLRRAAEEAQSGLISEMGSTAAAGPTMTDLGAALGISKQSGRKRAAAAAKWSEEHELPPADFSIEDLGRRYPPAGPESQPDSDPSAATRMHWPEDTSPPPDQFGNSVQTQEVLAQKAMAMGLGIAVNH